MRVIRTIAELRPVLIAERAEGRTVGLIPTMGALHEGHLSLVRAARARCDVTVVSIFVNPLQFGPAEDFAQYPRDEARDLELLEEIADFVFIPSVEDLYPPGTSTRVGAGGLGDVFEGVDRPGHFDGVATVVAKLFNIVSPDVAFFGQKDGQQLAVIRRVTDDLSFGIEIVACETVREADGLALSSRNAYLTRAERERATVLCRALEAGRDELIRGAIIEGAEKVMWDVLTSVDVVVPSYAAAVDPNSFGVAEPGRAILLIVAAHVGRTRLIDNMLLGTE